MMKKVLSFGFIFCMALSLVAIPNAIVHAGNSITIDQAKAIALDKAGYTEEEITLVKAKKEIDDNTEKYEIEFYFGTTEYDYEIDAATGSILSFDQEIEYIHGADNPKLTAASTPSKTESATKNGKVTKESAIAIALLDAGYAEKDVSLLHAKKDNDDGKEIWEVEFHAGHIEYSYDIEVATGTIINFDIDD